jgi:membrane protein
MAESPGKQSESIPGMIWEAVVRLFADEAIPLAGNIAFRTLFSAFPFLIFLAALSGFLGNDRLAASLVEFLFAVAPEQIVRPLENEILSVLTVRQKGLLSLSVLITIWTASGGVDSVRVGLNRAYDLKDHRSYPLLLAQNIAFVFVGALALLLLALLIVLGPLVVAFVNEHAPGAREAFAWFDFWRYPVAILAVTAVLIAAHKILPARKLKLADIWPGITFTLLVWILLSALFAQYLAHFSTFASTYAGLGGIAAAIFFLYLSAIVLIFGGEINRVIGIHRQNQRAMTRR